MPPSGAVGQTAPEVWLFQRFPFGGLRWFSVRLLVHPKASGRFGTRIRTMLHICLYTSDSPSLRALMRRDLVRIPFVIIAIHRTPQSNGTNQSY